MDKYQTDNGRDLASKPPHAEKTAVESGLPEGMDDFDQALPYIVETATALGVLARRHDLPFVVYLLEMSVIESSKNEMFRQ